MSATLVSYVGHYLVARVIYDDLVRPLVRGDVSVVLLVAIVGGLAFGVGRRSGRRA